MNKEQLYKFEDDIVDIYKKGLLRSPIHLSGSLNGELEDFLIDLFKEIKPNDWVFSTYRSHYHALLKGVPKEELKDWILDNKSIHFMSKKHKIFTSAIVGGCLPIALGVAMGIKLKEDKLRAEIDKSNEGMPLGKCELLDRERVFCFIGDMTASLGVFNDCLTYAINYKLPITFVIENNGLSTDTPTADVWGISNIQMDNHYKELEHMYPQFVKYIKYERKYPHYGCGVFVDFKDEGLKQGGDKF